MGQLISLEALSSHGADCIFDCGFSLSDADLGRHWFESGHIDGALYVDLNHDLSDPADHRGRHPLPDPEVFAERVRSWGVNQHAKIVCYDQNAGAFAARLWWLSLIHISGPRDRG